MKIAGRHTLRDYMDTAEAALLLAISRPACRVLSLDRLEKLLPPVRKGVSSASADAVVRAVDRAASRLPGRATCFPRAWTGAAMLRRRGIPAYLEFGLALLSDRLSGHVVAKVGDVAIVGGGEAEGFQTVRRLGNGR